MSEHHADPGPDPTGRAPKSPHEIERAKAKAAEARKQQDVQHDVERAQAEQQDEHAAEAAKADAAKAPAAGDAKGEAKGDAKSVAPAKSTSPAKKAAAKAPAKKTPAKKTPAKAPAKSKEAEPEDGDDETIEVVDAPIQPKQKPELSAEMAEALEARAAKKAQTPVFRRHEWWRYKDLGGKHASWRRPRGIHSKQRRHFKYRPPVVSIGYRGPRAARGLHPSGFEEVLVHRPEDLVQVDPKTQAARVGRTVGGRKAELIEKEADKLGIRVLNRRS